MIDLPMVATWIAVRLTRSRQLNRTRIYGAQMNGPQMNGLQMNGPQLIARQPERP
ncbi:hypothetical protein FHS29_005444 [Saccharothrix tamanrassetensis]|uniref:Uncharacterized protein n=1 Tax=Saccharothrix tamanrassetensis TaxID=1051531 RepID=A0A841CS87_9PSEU|nr:hypothetical protein [Saccharothrix tamanrassetensis]